jgi:hypothetical protein
MVFQSVWWCGQRILITGYSKTPYAALTVPCTPNTPRTRSSQVPKNRPAYSAPCNPEPTPQPWNARPPPLALGGADDHFQRGRHQFAQYGIAWPDGRLEIEGRLRLGWHHRWLFPDEPEPDLNKNRFYVQQARLKFSGWQYDSRIRWEMQFELRGYNGLEREAGHENDYQGLQAKDMHISWVPGDLLTVRLGQFKVPYGRKQLVPIHEHSMVKRADLVDGFLPGRDRGLMVRGRTGDRHITGWAGVFTRKRREQGIQRQFRPLPLGLAPAMAAPG